jgi:hypothetical protein
MNTLAAEYINVPEVEAEPTAEVPNVRSIFDIVRPQHDDPDELLRNRFLCRGGGLLFCGPTGIGKSSLGRQAAISWAIGDGCFGIIPARSLKSAIIQAEDDDGDEAEFRDGIVSGLKLEPSQIEQARGNVLMVREDARTSTRFISEVVAPLLEVHAPDLLWIDPALAYLGGEAGSQADVGCFLRNMLNPLLRRHDCGAIIVHHVNKPPSSREKPNWQASDFAYLGSGSAEWANWARAVLALRSIGSHNVFELRAAKRGGRLGWRDADGQTAYVKHLAHATEPGVICWREANPNEVPKAGRAKEYDIEEVFGLLPETGLAAGEWEKLAKTECGVKEASFQRARRELQAAGRVLKSPGSRKWEPSKKP